MRSAYVDESIRGQIYLVCAVIVNDLDIGVVQSRIRTVVLPRRRSHFNSESDTTREQFLDFLSDLPVEFLLLSMTATKGRARYVLRRNLLEHLVDHSQASGIDRLIIEDVSSRTEDVRTIQRARKRHPPLHFEHRTGATEPLLWAADAVAWSYGNSREWQARLSGLKLSHTRLTQ